MQQQATEMGANAIVNIEGTFNQNNNTQLGNVSGSTTTANVPTGGVWNQNGITRIGEVSGSAATLHVNGGTFTSASWLDLGNNGSDATLAVSGGGTVQNSTGGNLALGVGAAGTKTLSVTGAGSSIQWQNTIEVAREGTLNGTIGAGVIDEDRLDIVLLTDDPETGVDWISSHVKMNRDA